jgi:signal transduction histidine kinase
MITKKIVDGHKGVIEVESEKGAGSKFIIRLPEGPNPDI